MPYPILNKKIHEALYGPVKILPERVMQFGTGVLLRGLPDYFIDKANKIGIFNGSIVIVKSTKSGTVNEYEEQDGLFTHVIKGILDGKPIDNFVINTSISRVVLANSQWGEVIALAKSPDLKVIISNTTEAGVVFDGNDIINENSPSSFPGKLLHVLFERWKHFSNNTSLAGLVILPTELLPDNGKLLLDIVVRLAKVNQLPEVFISWIPTANDFCNTLVDRIVPGKLSDAAQLEVEQKLGFKDNLLISSEPFALWAIETNRIETKALLSFSTIDSSVVLAPSIFKFRELKLRLLNGTHTFCCGIAILAGFETVKQAMADADFRKFMETLLFTELVPCVVNDDITYEEANSFSSSVIDRFSNPTIEHKWTSIATGFLEKMKMRNVPLIEKYSILKNTNQSYMSLGFAAFCVYQEKRGAPISMHDFTKNIEFVKEVFKWVELIKLNGMMVALHEFVNNSDS